MISLTFIYAGTPLPDGRHATHLYVRRDNDGEFDLSPRAEKAALEDAGRIVADLIRENDPDDEERLLKRGEPSEDDLVIGWYKIIVRWDRRRRMATYHRGGYERFQFGAKWNPVGQLMMEQYDYIMSVLRKREKAERKAYDERKKGVKNG